MNDPLAVLALQPAEEAELARGNVVMRSRAHAGGGRDGVQGLVLTEVAPGVTWDLLEQWERMHEVLPALRLRVVQEASAENGDREALVVSEVAVGLITMRYTVRATFRRSEHRQWWTFVPHEELRARMRELPALVMHSRLVRNVEGSLTVYPHELGCLIEYQNYLVPHPTIPRAVEAFLSRQLVRDFLQAARRHARDLAAEPAVRAGVVQA